MANKILRGLPSKAYTDKDFWNKEINLYIVLDTNEKRKIILKDDFWS